MLATNKADQLSQNSLRSTKIHEIHVYDFDDILPLIDEFGIFQKYLFMLMMPFMFCAAVIYLDLIFITLVPAQYWCKVPLLINMPIEKARELSIPKEGDGYSKCKMYDVNYTDVMERNLTANESWPTTKCKFKYIYKFSDVPYPTIVTEYNWVCEKDKLPLYAIICYFMGAISGSLLYGYLADRIGRLPSIVSANFVGLVGGVGIAMSRSFLHFVICCIVMGMAFDSCFLLYFSILLEYVGPSYRTLIANMSIGLFYTSASCLIPWIAYYIGNWRTFAFVTSIPMALGICAHFIMPESARWLVSVGKIDEAFEILEYIAKINGRSIPPNVLDKFRLCCQQYHSEETQNREHSIFMLFKWLRLLFFALLLVLIWMITMLVYDVHVRAINYIATDIFVTFTIASLTELPSAVFLALTLDRCGRRLCTFFQMTACGALTIYAATMSDKSQMAIFAIAGRFFANNCRYIGLLYAAEILPTVIRAQGVAFIHLMGFVAALFSPYIISLGISDRELPFYTIGIMSVIGGLLTLLLPETLNEDLPQALSDGNKFGIDQPCCYSPCCACLFRRRSIRQSKRSWHSGASLREYISASLRSSQLSRKAFRTAYRTDALRRALASITTSSNRNSSGDLQGRNERKAF